MGKQKGRKTSKRRKSTRKSKRRSKKPKKSTFPWFTALTFTNKQKAQTTGVKQAQRMHPYAEVRVRKIYNVEIRRKPAQRL